MDESKRNRVAIALIELMSIAENIGFQNVMALKDSDWKRLQKLLASPDYKELKALIKEGKK